MAHPDVGLVTNAGPAHLERLGSIEGVARTKGELFAALGADGVAVINRDDDYFDYWRGFVHRKPHRSLSAVGPGRCPARAKGDDRGDARGQLHARAGPARRTQPHERAGGNRCGVALGVQIETIAAGLAAVESLPGTPQRARDAAAGD